MASGLAACAAGSALSVSVVRVRLVRQVGLRGDVDIHVGLAVGQVDVRRVGDLQVRGKLVAEGLRVEVAVEVLEVYGVLKVVRVIEIDDRQLDGKVRGRDHHQLLTVLDRHPCPGSGRLLLSRRIGHSFRPLGHPRIPARGAR